MLQLHVGHCAVCKNVRMQMEKRACFLPGDPRPPPTHMHSQSAGSPLLRWVGAEESSLKDGEIFNDLSELTRFEAKGEKERGKDPKTSEGSFLKSCLLLGYVYYLAEAIWIKSMTGEKRNHIRIIRI